MTNIVFKNNADSTKGELSTPRVKSGMGKRIFDWRVERQMPLNQLSRKSGVAYSLLFKLETEEGKIIKQVTTAKRLADAMNVNPAWLYGWIEEDSNVLQQTEV